MATKEDLMLRIVCFAMLALVGMTVNASAEMKSWVIDYDHSRLGFVGNQGGEPFYGGFKKYNAKIDFDLDKPEAGKIAVTIFTSSATAGSSDRDEYLPTKDWFDIGVFPRAEFVSTSIVKTGDAYTVTGDLTIKGQTHEVSLPFTLVPEKDHWRAQGKLSLERTDFHVGMGDWAGEAYVKHNVDIVVNFEVKPAS